MDEALLQETDHLLEGAVDTHMHTAPGAFPRHDTDHTAARKAKEYGMDAIVIKNHHFETASRASLASEENDTTVLGGITLNEWVGGLNPTAVDGLANFDPSIVWLPTITAANHLEKADVTMFADEEKDRTGIRVLDDDGDLVDDVFPVIDSIAEQDLVVGLSHINPTEAIAFVDAATDRGVSEFLVQHPHAAFLDYSLEEMRTITDLGATLEFHYISTTEMLGNVASIDDYLAAIDAVGLESVVMATDGGATANPPAIDMMRLFVREMIDAGVSEDDVKTMIETNPKAIFDLE